jgi:hypothetical protein
MNILNAVGRADEVSMAGLAGVRYPASSYEFRAHFFRVKGES